MKNSCQTQKRDCIRGKCDITWKFVTIRQCIEVLVNLMKFDFSKTVSFNKYLQYIND